MEIKNFKPKFEYTDRGNVKRYAHILENKAKVVTETNDWLFHDGVIWAIDKSGRQYRAIDALLEHIVLEVDEYFKDDQITLHNKIPAERRAQIPALTYDEMSPEERYLQYIFQCRATAEKWRFNSSSHAKMRPIYEYSAKEKELAISIEELDSKGYFLCVLNGILDLRTMKLVSNDPKYLVTKQCNATYKPEATCPEFEKFLDYFIPDKEEQAFMQRVFGQALIGEPVKDKCLFLFGNGANGKDTLTGILEYMIGTYGHVAEPKVITTEKINKDYHLAQFVGRRVVIMNELEQNAVLDDVVLRQLVGSGKITARNLYSSVIRFQCLCTPIVNTNNKPTVLGTEHGIWRRILMMEFKIKIPDEQKRPDYLQQKLYPEADGILNWALEGARKLIHETNFDLRPPQSIIDTTNSYRDDEDAVGQFIREVLEESPEQKIALKTIVAIYNNYKKQLGGKGMSDRRLKAELQQRGIEVGRGKGNINYVFGYTYTDSPVQNVTQDYGVGLDEMDKKRTKHLLDKINVNKQEAEQFDAELKRLKNKSPVTFN